MSSVAVPSDADEVLKALRFGWALAELRGRLRPGKKLVAIEPLSQNLRTEHALPLGGERKELEQLIETERVVGALAVQLSLDFASNLLSGQGNAGATPTSQRLVDLAKALNRARAKVDGPAAEKERADRWDELAEFLWAWDARIQDELAAAAFSKASAYQLGRGMGEVAWLDPESTNADEATSWSFVLGERRTDTLVRLLTRLVGYFQTSTAAGVKESLQVWHRAADDATVRAKAETQKALVDQTRRWRDLLLTGLDPLTLVPPQTFLARARQARHVLRSFWPELSVGLAGALLAAGAAALLASAKHHDSLAAFLAVIGAFGITTSGLVARAKTQAQALVTEFRNALDADLVIEAVLVPPRPAVKKWWQFW
jgi:hypothetical protein